jgi:hypothetical protein
MQLTMQTAAAAVTHSMTLLTALQLQQLLMTVMMLNLCTT